MSFRCLSIMVATMTEGTSEMSETSEKVSEMSSVEFTQYALRNHVAPPALGSVKVRLRHAARKLGWTPNRTKDAWYADPRISISADEIRKIEEKTGLRYGREELRTVDDLIARADALLDGPEADFFRPFADAIRAMARIAHRA
jgi:hypothetical protein